MSFVVRQSNIRAVKPGDPLFTLNDGLLRANRAGFEISQHCPREYRLIISECINNGWLKPVAYITADEQFIETLKL
jgi:hypothetical protein